MGVHENAPLLEPIEAPDGAPASSENVSVCAGVLASVAVAVNDSVAFSFTDLLPIAASTGATFASSATAKSLNEVMLLTWMLVAVGDDVDCVLHEIPLYFWTLNKLVVEPASTSPESQFSTTLALVNPTLPLLSV